MCGNSLPDCQPSPLAIIRSNNAKSATNSAKGWCRHENNTVSQIDCNIKTKIIRLQQQEKSDQTFHLPSCRLKATMKRNACWSLTQMYMLFIALHELVQNKRICLYRGKRMAAME